MPREKWRCLYVTTYEAALDAANKFRKEYEWQQQAIAPSKALAEGQAKLLAEHLED